MKLNKRLENCEISFEITDGADLDKLYELYDFIDKIVGVFKKSVLVSVEELNNGYVQKNNVMYFIIYNRPIENEDRLILKYRILTKFLFLLSFVFFDNKINFFRAVIFDDRGHFEIETCDVFDGCIAKINFSPSLRADLIKYYRFIDLLKNYERTN